MVTPDLGAEEGFPPDPEDWPTHDSHELSPEVLHNEADDLSAALEASAAGSTEADEADLLDQLRDAGPDDEGVGRAD